MLTKKTILEIAAQRKKVTVDELVKKFAVSRQYVNRLVAELVKEGKLIKFGVTRSVFYILPQDLQTYQLEALPSYQKTFTNRNLEEHLVLDEIEGAFPVLRRLQENLRSIWSYAFSEMLNNAIEHSNSSRITIEVIQAKRFLNFMIRDFGIGVFRNVMKKRKLKSELEAIQDILKGKTSTMPKSHSGEGIFFTSKVADLFVLESFDYQLMINNELADVFVSKLKRAKKGTAVMFQIALNSKRHLNDVFRDYTNLSPKSDYGFDKTEVRIKLYALGGVYVSRSQARRVLAGLEKFKVIVFDFDQVSTVGQAFADEIFRVFHNKYPEIRLETENMEEAVQFMVKRARYSEKQ